MIIEITNIGDLQDLVERGETNWEQYGDVATKEKDGLILFNYTIGATLAQRWNWFERNARGLILNRTTGDVVARPFEKIFNWGEEYENVIMPLGHDVKRITEKMDGSLGILYRPVKNIIGSRRLLVATRGSFESDQAKWATERLYYYHMMTDNWLPKECTLLFEIIYPENRIVVDYGNQRMLVLLAARSTETGEYYDSEFIAQVACRYDFITVAYHSMPRNAHEIATLVRNWDNGREGVVAEFADGSRWKFKADAYVQVHRLLNRLSFKRILEAVREGVIDDTLPLLPLHLQKGVLAAMDEIAQVRHEVRERVLGVYNERPVSEARKDFAQWVLINHKDVSMYLFRLYDGQDIDREIWKYAFKDYTPKTVVLPTTTDEDEYTTAE